MWVVTMNHPAGSTREAHVRVKIQGIPEENDEDAQSRSITSSPGGLPLQLGVPALLCAGRKLPGCCPELTVL